MAQGSRDKRVVARVLDEMQKQCIGYVQLGARLRYTSPACGWSQEYVALRLGELLPGPPFGGRIPLTGSEIEQMARALSVPVAELLGEHQLALATAS